MKYALGLVCGLLLGTLSALALLYFNPLTLNQSVPPDKSEWVLEYKLGADNVWLSTHDNRLEIPIVPRTAPLLWEDGIRGAWLAAMPLTSASEGANAAATRISVPSSETEFLHSGVVVEDHWLISVPGAGTIFVHAVNNQWPLLRDTVVRVDLLGREFVGPGSYDSTRGPDEGRAYVVGMTGRYQSSHGQAHERLSLDSYDGSLDGLSGQLRIALTDDSD